MTKQEILERLSATYFMLLSLEQQQFNYGDWVTKLEDMEDPIRNACNTVACVGGWYPFYFPEAGIEWYLSRVNDFRIRKGGNSDELEFLAEWHSINRALARALFVGSSLNELDYFDSNIDMGFGGLLYDSITCYATLAEVTERWALIIKDIEEGKLNNFLVLNP